VEGQDPALIWNIILALGKENLKANHWLVCILDFEGSNLFSFLIYKQSVGLFGREIGRRKAATYTPNNMNTDKTHTGIHTSSGIWTQDSVFKRAKTFHGVDRAATVIVIKTLYYIITNSLKELRETTIASA
jgi:hypothetical protein